MNIVCWIIFLVSLVLVITGFLTLHLTKPHPLSYASFFSAMAICAGGVLLGILLPYLEANRVFKGVGGQ